MKYIYYRLTYLCIFLIILTNPTKLFDSIEIDNFKSNVFCIIKICFLNYLWNIINFLILSIGFNFHKRGNELNLLISGSRLKFFMLFMFSPLLEELLFRLIFIYANIYTFLVYISYIIIELLFNEKYTSLSSLYKIIFRLFIFLNILFGLCYIFFPNNYGIHFVIINGLTFGLLHCYNYFLIDNLTFYSALSSQGILGIIISLLAFKNGFIISTMYHYINNMIAFIPFMIFIMNNQGNKASIDKNKIYLVDENGVLYMSS